MLDLDDPRSRVVGTKQVLRALTGKNVEKVFIAQDADESVKLMVANASDEQSILKIEVTTMRELGDACGIKVGAAAAAKLKTNE